VATNDFVYSNIDVIDKKTWGLISILPKDSEGKLLAKKDTGVVFKKEYQLLISYFLKNSGKF